MGKHKEHPVNCAMCGLTFTALGNTAKYCRECAPKAAAAQRARSSAKLKETRATDDETYHFCDNQAQIQACLNCTDVGCMSGECPRNKELGRKRQGKPKINAETREKVFDLRAKGMTHKDIAQEVGIAVKTVSRFIREREQV